MRRRSGLALASLAIVVAAILAVHPAAAFDFAVSNPVVHGNLAVYPVHGGGGAGANLLTLDEAVQQGTVKIHESDDGPLQIVNASGRGVFVHGGTLLVGGLQDQVVAGDTIVGPHSSRPLYTYCVDPFRSTARSDVDANSFAGTGMLFPWPAAKLSLVTGLTRSPAVARPLRQAGVWWSIDSLRSRLSERIGEAVEPARIPEWSRDEVRESRARLQLAARTSPWTTSLPLALQNERLVQTVAPYLDALQRIVAGEDVIGVVVAIDGKFTAADVYGSSDLMRRMWPALARAAATEAIAMGMGTAPPVPSAVAAKAFLETALAAPAQMLPPALAMLSNEAHGFTVIGLHETESAIASDTIGAGGIVHRSVVAKLDPAAATRTPDALIVQTLETGSIKLNDGEVVVLQRDAQDRWAADVRSMPRPADVRSVPLAAAIEPGQVATDRIVTVLAAANAAQPDQHIMQAMLPLALAAALVLALVGTMLALGRPVAAAARVQPA